MSRAARRPLLWLGDRRGALVDWLTQLWVRATGRRIDRARDAWLDGPIGTPSGIALADLDAWARSLDPRASRQFGRGLLLRFGALDGNGFRADAIDPAIAHFYEHTADYDVDVWSEWCAACRPFGWAVSAIFSRRLGQLNLPLSPLDVCRGMTSDVWTFAAADGEPIANAWVRSLVKTGRVTYVGTYSVSPVPNAAVACVKTVFPLPNGNAIVLLRPRAMPDGSLALISEGTAFGDPGFYFTVHRPGGAAIARYVRSFRERIHVYPSTDGFLRADHTMALFGLRCLHLHYRLRRRAHADV